MAVITLLTDFGLKDIYVGVMKGVILNINPEAKIIDLTHDISPQDIKEAVFLLGTAYQFFPKGTIHVIVVDPGVGSERRAILGVTKNYFFIAPDNGVLELIYQKEDIKVYHLNRPQYYLPQISSTFHGRDVFAPIAAHLSLGVSPETLGEEIFDYKRLDFPKPLKEKNSLKGEIIYIDHFGNLISNIRKEIFETFVRGNSFLIRIKNILLDQIVSYYQAVKPGKILALWDSSGYLEIAQFLGRADEALNVSIGEKIEINIRERL